MGQVGLISKNSSNLKEELQNYYFKLTSGSKVSENFLLSLIDNEEISQDHFEILEKIANFYQEKKNTELNYKIFKKLSIYSDKYLGYVIDHALSRGELYLAELAGKKYLNYLVKKKNFKIGLKIIDELIKAGIGKDFINDFHLIFMVLKGDLPNVRKIFSSLKYDFSNDETYRMILNISKLKRGNDKKWEEFKEFKKFELLKLFYWIKDLDPANISLRKEFFNNLFEFKCHYPEDNFGLIFLSKYARFYKCRPLISAVNDYLQNNKKKITKEEYYRAIEDVGTYRETADVSNTGKNDKEEKNVSSIARRILENDKILNKEFFINERCFVKVCELLDDELVNKFYEDLTICFLTMEFFEVAHSILNRIEKNLNSLSLKERINHEYLRLSVLMNEKKFWEVSSRIDSMLLDYPLVAEEENCFLYLKAEAQFFLGRKKEAKEIYLKIKRNSPNYRLVENRLLEIEINK